MRSLIWLGIFIGARGVQGETLAKDELCVTAIFSAYNYISFQGDPAKGMWDARCRNPLKVTSIYASSERYCRDGERLTGLAQLAKLCQEVGHRELLSRDSVAENLTREAVRDMRVVDYLELSRADYQKSPVLLSASYYNRMFDTIDSWQFETWSHHAFGYIGYAYWAGILSLGILYRLWNRMFLARQHRMEYNPEPSIYPPTGSCRQISFVDNVVNWVSTHLIIPAPLAGRGRHLLSCTFTSRAEALVVGGFWLLSIILSVVGYRTFPGNIYWPDVTSQLLRYSADRTGIMSFANFPLLLLFAGRNNVLIWATGWSFATLNCFHRHVARIATLQAVAHSILYFVICIRISKVWKEMTKVYVLWGVLAFVLMILVLITSLDRVRAASYEIFMVAHVVFSIATLVGCFYHTVVFEGHEYWQYLWPSVIVWAIDRFLRLVRIVYCNVHVRLSKGKVIHVTESRMTYDEAADVIRLEVKSGLPGLEVRPGDYYFLYQPFRFTGWENHPFTVGASSYEVDPMGVQLDDSGNPRNSFDNSQLPLLPSTLTEGENLETRKGPYQRSLASKMTFWIRPYDGWTQQLRQQCLRAPNQPVHTNILLEGPYGQGFPLWRYESVLMIVGGTGIAAAVPYLQDHRRRCANQWSSPSEEKPRTKKIELVWTTRQSAFVRGLADRELNMMLNQEDFRASFYVTGSSDRFHEDWNSTRYTVQLGRPNLQSLILSRASDASATGMKLAIVVCGPAEMADEARAAAHLAMRRGYQPIQYVEESFTW
ncbi:putative plasma membrane ferric-chelate reductase (Fre2) [Penicillium brasilianum]|uniref:Putative plasma membrane ferric-chelate reductase (Fre2) n=1 Tax=Penicillium brasilianum TaxID=104259 RepID=A0A1S9RBC5_PENBI|nr:putative plasma membrane ferric-chelate reductase (Fre2) [Penicillium brasilianum]